MKQISFWMDSELVDWLKANGGIRPTIIRLIKEAMARHT
jgi:hypothetical protein